MQRVIGLGTVLLSLVAACSPATKESKSSTELPNPASTHCAQSGGTLDIKTGPEGQYGLCRFPDGSYCEEWAFFRRECKKGEQFEKQGDSRNGVLEGLDSCGTIDQRCRAPTLMSRTTAQPRSAPKLDAVALNNTCSGRAGERPNPHPSSFRTFPVVLGLVPRSALDWLGGNNSGGGSL